MFTWLNLLPTDLHSHNLWLSQTFYVWLMTGQLQEYHGTSTLWPLHVCGQRSPDSGGACTAALGRRFQEENERIWLLCVCVLGEFCGPLHPERMWKWDQLCNKRQKCPFQNKTPLDCCTFAFTQDSLGFLFKKKETAPGVFHSYGHMKCLYLLGRLILCETGSTEMREHTKVVGCGVKATRDK